VYGGNWSRVNTTGLFKQHVFELGVDHTLSEPVHCLASVLKSSFSTNCNTGLKPKIAQLNPGVDYYLLKRTDLYSLASYASHKNGGRVGNIASPAVQRCDSKSNQTSVALGIRHHF
jgi:predicted porin